jgi:hypothetical protein
MPVMYSRTREVGFWFMHFISLVLAIRVARRRKAKEMNVDVRKEEIY